jgi:hypothetical protein
MHDGTTSPAGKIVTEPLSNAWGTPTLDHSVKFIATAAPTVNPKIFNNGPKCENLRGADIFS